MKNQRSNKDKIMEILNTVDSTVLDGELFLWVAKNLPNDDGSQQSVGTMMCDIFPINHNDDILEHSLEIKEKNEIFEYISNKIEKFVLEQNGQPFKPTHFYEFLLKNSSLEIIKSFALSGIVLHHKFILSEIMKYKKTSEKTDVSDLMDELENFKKKRSDNTLSKEDEKILDDIILALTELLNIKNKKK